MPTDERTTPKWTDRCETHPGVPSVAHCDRCGRALCVECAVPVRGRVLGPECLGELVGEDAETLTTIAPARPKRPGMAALGGAFLVAALLTMVPWTRFGHGSGAFDAWRWPGWSLFAAAASTLGLGFWALQWWRPRMTDRAAGWTLAALGITVTVASLLAATFAPSLTKPTPVPWLVSLAGLASVVASIRVVRKAGGRRG